MAYQLYSVLEFETQAFHPQIVSLIALTHTPGTAELAKNLASSMAQPSSAVQVLQLSYSSKY